MDEIIETIRVAVAPAATSDQRAAGIAACRALIAALGAEVGKPLVPATTGATPPPRPLAGFTIDQALDLAIAKLRSMVPAESKPAAASSLTIPLVGVPRSHP